MCVKVKVVDAEDNSEVMNVNCSSKVYQEEK